MFSFVFKRTDPCFLIILPFFFICFISILFFLIAWLVIPPIRGHLLTDDKGKSQHFTPGEVIKILLDSPNQQLALLFGLVLILGHFTIIPFIAPYFQINIGFTDSEIAIMYAIGGTLTAICLPIFGRLADRYGHISVFTVASIGALFSIYAFTQYTGTSIVLGLLVSSFFFIVASGRSVPATTMVASVVKPENRGSFMAMRQSVNQAGLFLSSFIGGLIIVENGDGTLGNYQYVGYFAIAMSVLAVFLASKLKMIRH